MKTRNEVHELLVEALGNSNVYYQAPPNTGMKYPCIVYHFGGFNRDNADNLPYILTGRWDVTHIYKSIKNDKTLEFLEIFPNRLSFDRRIVTDGVYNDYYTLNI